MANDYYNAPQKAYDLVYNNIQTHAEEIRNYIDQRRKGNTKSLKTRWAKFNGICMGGIEPNTLYTVAGISGTGKSSFVNSLEVDLFDLNPNVDFVVLNFTSEMKADRQIGRKLSYKLQKTTSELYSGNVNMLSDHDFEKVNKELEKIKRLPIYYVENPGTVDEIKRTILKFSEREGKNKWVIIILDHTLLVKKAPGEDDRTTLISLQRMFMEVKKFSMNTVIQLTQMNRNIESVDRIANKSMHFPMRNDLSSSDSIMQSSDIVLVLHNPHSLGITAYGPRNLPTEGLIYLSLLKNRDGEAGVVIPFINNLKYNRLDETTIDYSKNNTDEIKLNF